MHDKNAEIRKVCDNTLDIIGVSGRRFGEEHISISYMEHPPCTGGHNKHTASVGFALVKVCLCINAQYALYFFVILLFLYLPGI